MLPCPDRELLPAGLSQTTSNEVIIRSKDNSAVDVHAMEGLLEYAMFQVMQRRRPSLNKTTWDSLSTSGKKTWDEMSDDEKDKVTASV